MISSNDLGRIQLSDATQSHKKQPYIMLEIQQHSVRRNASHVVEDERHRATICKIFVIFAKNEFIQTANDEISDRHTDI